MGREEKVWTATSDHPRKLLEILEPELLAGRLQRKWRLYLCACARRLDQMLSPLDRDALDVAERFADGQASLDELLWTRKNTTGRSPAQIVSNLANNCLYRNGTFRLLELTLFDNDDAAALSGDTRTEFRIQAALVKDIFGNPFQPMIAEPCWKSSTVLDLARTIYDRHRYELLPLLGDALMDAGCDSADWIDHCQYDAPHARGCWVIDSLLGKSATARRFALLTPDFGSCFKKWDGDYAIAARIGF